jgi:DNA-binding SARP family transcriptional activator
MEFRLLGPLEVHSAGRIAHVKGFKKKAALGYLLLKMNQVVSTSQLTRALWVPERRPATARKMVQNAVCGLRRMLMTEGPEVDGRQAPALVTRSPGYILSVDPWSVDLFVFEHKLAEGRNRLHEGAPGEASVLLREAVSLWRGPALEDIAEAGLQWPELDIINEARLNAMEELFQAELEIGRHRAILNQLELLTAAEPFRERACAQLMLALYRCGRQTDALKVFERTRNTMVESLGLEPGRELKALQWAILRQDPVLRRTSTGEPAAVSITLTRSRMTRSRAPGVDSVGRSPQRNHGQSRDVGIPRGAPVRDVSRNEMSALLIRLASPREQPGSDTGRSEQATALYHEVEGCGGKIKSTVGIISVALFAAHDRGEHPAILAVRTAMKLSGRRSARKYADACLVVTGEIVVPESPGPQQGALTITGRLMERGQHLLMCIPKGEIWFSEAVYRQICSTSAYKDLPTDLESWHALSIFSSDGETGP